MTTGAQIIAQSLKKLNVGVVFGLVGIPVIEIADALQDIGIAFVAFRNEQSASYAASVYGYLTGKPGVLLVVGGPGIVHALAGVFNSQVNGWPLLVLAGSADKSTKYKGAFQELDQLEAVSSFTKFRAQLEYLDDIPRIVQKAWRLSVAGVCGTSYIDIPGNIIVADSTCDIKFDGISDTIPRGSVADHDTVENVAAAVKSARFPLVIVGKGAASAEATKEIRAFVEAHKLPFIPTPMGKGVISDYSEFNLSSARSLALKNADLVLILGARLNWILHFGQRFSPETKIVQVNKNSEEIGENFSNSQNIELGLVGDIKQVTKQLDYALKGYTYNSLPEEITTKIKSNVAKINAKELASSPQLNYHNVYRCIREYIVTKKLQDDTIIVSEGANTMDNSRTHFPITLPKHRLDAGTNSTMGIGMGYCIAAKMALPSKKVLAIEGDSAFGFSAMELETAVRYKLGMVIVVMNNSGIYHGISDPGAVKRPIELSKETKYHVLAEGLGADGYLVENLSNLSHSLEAAFSNPNSVSVLNVIIEPGEQKKVAFGWQNAKL